MDLQYLKMKDIKEIKPNFNAIKKLPYDGIIVTAPGINVDFVSRFLLLS